MNLLLTGATGFIGKNLLKSFSDKFEKIYITVRPKSIYKAQEEFEQYSNIVIVESDITDDQIIFNQSLKTEILENVDTVIHSAAIYDLKAGDQESYFINVIGTQNICSLAKNIKKLNYFHYLSTIAVAGIKNGVFKEDELDEHVEFGNSYAKSKMNAEQIFRRCDLKNVKKRIYRPGIVVGSTIDGSFEKIDGPYYFLKLLYQMKQKFPLISHLPFFAFPCNKEIQLPIIPIDYLVLWLVKMVLCPGPSKALRTYHLLDANHVTIDHFLKKALLFFGYKCTTIAVDKKYIVNPLIELLGIPKESIDYMYNNIIYDCTQRENDFPDLKLPSFSKYQHTIFKGAENFFKQEIK